MSGVTSRSVTTSAPGKLMLFGDHAVVYDRPCIVTAIDQRIKVTVTRIQTTEFILHAPEVHLPNYSVPIAELRTNTPKGALFLETLYAHFLERFPQIGGIEIQTTSDFNSSFGFGSSSASTVAFCRGLSELFEILLTKKELFDLCYQTVLSVQGVGSGFDIASAIWGGTIYYVKPASVVEQLDAKEMPLIVGYTGIKADTATLIKQVADQRNKHFAEVEKIFDQIADITESAQLAISGEDWSQTGQLMNSQHKLLKKLHVSSRELNTLISASVEFGAFGAKLSGAGGGDCMIALTDLENEVKVTEAIEAVGGEIMNVKMHAVGVQVVQD